MGEFPIAKRYPYFIAGVLVFLGLYVASLHSYLLFHSLAEIFSIVVACGIFMVTWNSRRFLDNNYLLFLGIAYLFVGGIDLIHTLAYKGMGIFEGHGTNLATQLWIAARYTESLSFLIAPFFIRRKVKINLLFLSYLLAFSLILLSIFYWNLFPACFIEGIGLTPFKKISEYVISLIFLASIPLLLKHRSEFDRDVLKWVVWSIIFTIASELAFTFYMDVYGLLNLLGHFLKIVSFYLIYKALIEIGLTRPYDLLFRNLKEGERKVREEKNKLQNYLDIAGVILVAIDANHNVGLINKKGCEILGYGEKEIIGKKWFDAFIPERIREEVKADFRKLMNGEAPPIEYFENPVLTKTGEERMIAWYNSVLRDEKGKVISTLSSGEDITERKRVEKELREAKYDLEFKIKERTAELQQTNERLEEKNQERIRTEQSLRLEEARLDALLHLSQISEASLKEITGFTLEHAIGLTQSKIGFVGFLNEDESVYTLHAVSKDVVKECNVTGDPLQWHVVDAGIWADAVREHKTLFVNDYSKPHPRKKGFPPGHPYVERFMVVPILEGERIVAVAGVGNKVSDYDKSDERQITLLLSGMWSYLQKKRSTEEMAKANELLERMFSSIDISIAYMDKDFNFIRVNRAYADAHQREPEFYVGKNHFVLFPNEQNEQIFRKVVETGEPYSVYAKPLEYAEHTERGVTYWDWSLQPVRDPDGNVGGVVLSLVDVTERIRAQEAVASERQRFYDVLEMLPAYLILLTPDYHVPFANRFFRERFGESNGKRCFEYLFGRNEPCEICESYNVLKTGASHQWEWTGPDGRIYDVTDFPFSDADGSPFILEMGIDITKRKQAEEALKAAHQYTRNLIEASLDPFVTISPDGKVTDVNTATELATGISREQLLRTDFSNYFTEPEKAREGYQTAFLRGTVRDYPLAIRHASGMITDVLYNATIYRNEAGKIQGVFAAARDITERKRAEEALRGSEARLRDLSSRLLTAQESERKRIALELHDSIGQMLTAIKFKVENTLQEKRKGAANAEEKSLEAIIPLVKETIEEVRRMQMDLRPSTLDDLGVLATLGWFCREYQKIYSHIRIEKEIAIQENEIPDPLKVVLYRLTQEAMNNIAKHSHADVVRLSLRNQESQLECIVEDNGMGFDVENTLFSEGPKRGLGLGSMRERTELSGGKFMIESTQGKGTTIKASWLL